MVNISVYLLKRIRDYESWNLSRVCDFSSVHFSCILKNRYSTMSVIIELIRIEYPSTSS
jgi:hypothetical protein